MKIFLSPLSAKLQASLQTFQQLQEHYEEQREELLLLDYLDINTSQDYVDLSRPLLQISANAISLTLKSNCSQRATLISNHPAVLISF